MQVFTYIYILISVKSKETDLVKVRKTGLAGIWYMMLSFLACLHKYNISMHGLRTRIFFLYSIFNTTSLYILCNMVNRKMCVV